MNDESSPPDTLLSQRVRRAIPLQSFQDLFVSRHLDYFTEPALGWHEWALLSYLTLLGGYSVSVATLIERSKGEPGEVLTALEGLLERGDIELDSQELDQEVAAQRAF